MKPLEAIIETKKLSHIYSAGTPFEHGALIDVDFTAYRGEYLGIIGHTGSGKSTLIQHLNALLKPTSGQVLLEGRDIWSDPKTTRETRFRVGLVFQYPEYQLFEETVYKDIAFGPKNMGCDEKEVDRRVREAAAFVGLRDEQLSLSPFELSGGQKRRVAIAGVIAMEPSVLILDEPTAGLDPVGVEDILGNIRDYHNAKNATILIVSHSMEEVARTVDRLVVVNDGRIPFEGSPREVFAHGDELTAMGLGVPTVTRVFHRLRELGADVDPSVYTIEQAKAAFLEALKRKGAV
ncbi:MAG TPA: energy-coupling factor transporter ATPase [Candidatus Galloscillospira stercoripullorum]|nr:energy-coupling factor transporter ATPase [Candidatus Galloscillospira stercoripullorum]